MNLGELFVQIGAIGNSKEVKAFGNAVKKAGNSLDKFDKQFKLAQTGAKGMAGAVLGATGAVLGVLGAVALAYNAMDRLTESLAKQNIQWLNLTRQSDIALSTFQKWGTIGKIVGVENAAQQLESLNQKIFNLRLTGEGAKGFQIAGIMPTTADDVLEQLRGRISGMSNTAATYLLQQMGLDPKMITLLRMGREEWEQYLEVQRKYTLNEKQRKEIDRMNRQLEVARIKMQYLKDRAVLAIMPYFVKMAQSVARVSEALARFCNWIGKGINLISNIRVGCLRLGGIIKTILIPALVALAAAFFPIQTAILAVLASWYLLIDDFMTFKQGGKSVIGLILGAFDQVSNAVNFATPQWIKDLLRIIENIDNLVSLPEKMKNNTNVDAGKATRNLAMLTNPVGIELLMLSNSLKFWGSKFGGGRNISNSVTNNTNAPQITVYTSADTIKDIYQPVYLQSQSMFGY